MLKNYLKAAWRSILKQRGYSFINVFGLASGMACCIFLLLWVQDELSYDRFHENAARIFRVEAAAGAAGGERLAEVPCALAPAVGAAIPEVEHVTRVFDHETMRLQHGEHSFYEGNVSLVDPSFFQIFSFPLLEGEARTVLSQPYSMVLAKKTAEKYFGDEEAVGKTMLLNGRYSFTVTGIMRDAPANSTVQPQILIPMQFMDKVPGEYDLGWREFCWTTWVRLREPADSETVAEKISAVFRRNSSGLASTAALMPLADIRLAGRNIETVYILTALAVFILLLACINFINLATARSSKRAREIGVRKVVGAARKNIMAQFFCESLLLSLLALAAALAMVIALLPAFNGLAEKAVGAGSLFSLNFILCIAAITILTGAASGSYPALLLAAFDPVKVLKGAVAAGSRSGWLRRTLVIGQFCLSIILLVGTLVITRQLDYLRHKSIGYDREQLLYLPLADELRHAYPAFKDEVRKRPGLSTVTGTSQRPTMMGRGINGAGDWEGKQPGFDPRVDYGQVDVDYVVALKIPLLQGRSFSPRIVSDRSQAVLVNETLMNMMGPGPVLGRRFVFSGRPGLKAFQGTVIGVMKDFHYRRLQDRIGPLALFAAPEAVAYAILRLPAGESVAALAAVRAAWRKVFAGAPFEYKFFDEDFARMFRADERLRKLVRSASLLAILISCLGLFGLASFMVEQRTREIGIRKVLGATARGIAFLLSKEFFAWIVVANLLACPLAYILANKWLEGYSYRITVRWWIFALGVLLTLLSAALTVGWQTLRAARANPVRCIKYE
ncbi:MAG TPA: ABC transporter permease [Patescibacteria group bacterium]|nr:ABC transporter permease [Patescibacteria group bacterium]